MVTPPGLYPINTFLQLIQNGSLRFTKYVFVNITDLGLIPYNYESEGGAFLIINDLTSGGANFALSAEQGVVLKNSIDSLNITKLLNLVGQSKKLLVVNNAEGDIEFVDRTYVHDQGTPAIIWTITHSLKKYPSVTVKNSAGDTVEGLIHYVDENNIILTFNAGFSGSAILN